MRYLFFNFKCVLKPSRIGVSMVLEKDCGKNIWFGGFDGRGEKKWWWNSDTGVGCCYQQVSCVTAANYRCKITGGSLMSSGLY